MKIIQKGFQIDTQTKNICKKNTIIQVLKSNPYRPKIPLLNPHAYKIFNLREKFNKQANEYE